MRSLRRLQTLLAAFSIIVVLSTCLILNRNGRLLSSNVGTPGSRSNLLNHGTEINHQDGSRAGQPSLDDSVRHGTSKTFPGNDIVAADHKSYELVTVSYVERKTPLLTPSTPPRTSSSTTRSYATARARPSGRIMKAMNNHNISVVESGGSHDEVTAALVHAFGTQGHARMRLYLLLQRYGISDIMKRFKLSSPIVAKGSLDDFSKEAESPSRPNILVLVTCEHSLNSMKGSLEYLLKHRKTYLFCVVHHADQWVKGDLVEKIQPWVQQGLMDFITLSEHTSHYIRTKAISKWPFDANVTVNTLPPVFPVTSPTSPGTNDITESDAMFAIQGDYSSSRRNYTSIFEHLETVVETAKNVSMQKGVTPTPRGVKLHLLGHGKQPDVPARLRDHVVFDERLDYADYYGLLSKTFAIVPAFATNGYLDRKASSSVPAALIGGAPLIADQKILDAYSYLPRDAVWLRNEDESELDVVRRIAQLSTKKHDEKREVVKMRCQEIVKNNTDLVRDWISIALLKIKEAG